MSRSVSASMRKRGPWDKQQVLWILCELLRSRFCALPVSGRHHHQLVHMLDVPSAVAELDGQPVEQFGMRWPLAHDAKIFSCFDESGSEYLVPHPVHGHARGERVLRN